MLCSRGLRALLAAPKPDVLHGSERSFRGLVRTMCSDRAPHNITREFLDNLNKHFKENRFSSADKAFQLISNNIEANKRGDALQYFRGLYAVTEAYLESFPPNESSRNALLALSDILKESQAGVKPVRVAVTGASGNIAYSLLFRLAAGEVFGRSRPIDLRCFDLADRAKILEGVRMELDDCSYSTLQSLQMTSDLETAFAQADYIFLVGSRPRGAGMERKDLLASNAQIFVDQGRAINKVAPTAKVLVIGNPANTNAMVLSQAAPALPSENISSMMRLDHNRAIQMLAQRAKVLPRHIEQFAVWGNHSSTQVPLIDHAVAKGKNVKEMINDDAWITKTFTPAIQQRGAQVIAFRGGSSAASAASSAMDHVHDWVYGTRGRWTSMGVVSRGEYGVTPGLFYGYPVVCTAGRYQVVQDLPIDEAAASLLESTHKELLQERDHVSHLLQ